MNGEAAAPPPLTREEARASCDAQVAHTLRPLLLACIIFLTVSIAATPLTLEREDVVPVVVAQAILAATFILARVSTQPGRNGARHVHAVFGVLVVGAIATTLTTMVVTGNLLLTTGHVVVILGVGVIVLSWRWLVALVVLCIGSWLAVVAGLGFPDGWDEVLFSVLAAGMLSAMAHHGRLTMHLRHAALRRQETRQTTQLRSIVAAAPVILMAVDREGRVTIAEGKGLGDRGWDGSKVVGLEAQAVLADFARDGRVYETFWTPLSGESGAPEGAICVAMDVTERVRAEDDARKAAERESAIARLEEMDRFKTRLLNTASHELNTPLTPIKLQMHLLKREAARLDERHQRAVAVLDRNFERLSALVSDILDVARIQGKNLRVEPTRIDLRAALEEACRSYESVAQEKGLRLAMDAPDGVDAMADQRRVLQVLFNLLSNAMKFTPAGGEVHVKLRSDAHGAVVSVRDTGAGLTAEQRSRLFAPFSQVHDAVQHDVGGTGLGLYISRGIVEQMGGTLRCESDGEGKGATFTMKLPRG